MTVKLDKLYTVNLYVSLSALYTLQYVPIVTYSCKLLYSKNKKKKKTTRTPVWVKNTKVMPQYPTIYLFFWEREGILTSQDLT